MKSNPETTATTALAPLARRTLIGVAPRPSTTTALVMRRFVLTCLALLLCVDPAFSQQFGSLRGPRFFDQLIFAAGPASHGNTEAALLLAAIEKGASLDELELAGLLARFTTDYPDSIWTPWLLANLGEYYRGEGNYSKALQLWEQLWQRTKDYQVGPAKRAADYALAHWTRLLVEMGRLEALGVIFSEHGDRRLDGGPLLQKYLRSMELYGKLQRTPAASYRCGWLTINELSTFWRGHPIDSSLEEQLYQEHNLFRSCSMTALGGILTAEQWGMIGVERPAQRGEFPVPALMHLKIGHYVALLKEQGDYVLGYDPILGTRWLRKAVLNEEGSGRFLTPAAQVPAGWRQLSREEMDGTVGRCWLGPMPDDEEADCSEDADECPTCPTTPSDNPKKNTSPNGSGEDGRNPTKGPIQAVGGCSSCGGMIRWSVGEPTINLWLKDTPISCQPALGPAVDFRLAFKQRDEYAGYPMDVFNFGAGWTAP